MPLSVPAPPRPNADARPDAKPRSLTELYTDPALFHVPNMEKDWTQLAQETFVGRDPFQAVYGIDLQYAFYDNELAVQGDVLDYGRPALGSGVVSPVVGNMPIWGYSDTGVPLVKYNGDEYSRIALSYSLACVDHVTNTVGRGLNIGSGYRSDAEQQVLYDRDPQNAAAPGRSKHRTGHAVDLGVGGGSSRDRRLLEADAWCKAQGASTLLHQNAGGGGYHVHVNWGPLAGAS